MNNISEIDRNFHIETSLSLPGVRFYDVLQPPFALHGLTVEDGAFCRMPGRTARAVNDGVAQLYLNTAGGRVRFCTDSPYVAVHARMRGVGKMPHFALTGSAGFDLYADNAYAGTFVPPFDLTDGYESVVYLPGKRMRTVEINFPLYSGVAAVYVGLADSAAVEAATPYAHPVPAVYYGSSITQGGCASRPGCAYQALLSRWFSVDHINLGFSGSARGEDAMAAYLAGLEASLFVCDYDHNAPTADHLAATHERLFRAVREKHPALPVIFLSRPKRRLTPDEVLRRDVVRATFDRARAAGDANVYFLDGPALTAFAGDEGTVDDCHPTDLGFYSMAKALSPIFAEIYGKR